MKRIKTASLLIFLSWHLFAQNQTELSIEQCYQLARQNFPLIKQSALIDQAKEYNISNASKGFLPQFNIAGQATYQSEVTKVPINLPNVHITELSKDQYKLYGELNQSLTDGLIIKQQKELIKANAASETEKVEVELYKLKERINQIYFGILLMDAQIQQTQLIKKDIAQTRKKTEAALNNGVAIRSGQEQLQAEELKLDQKITELNAARKSYLEMLGVFINQSLNDNVKLKIPIEQTVSNTINRPEIRMYESQKRSFEIQNKLTLAKNLPRLSLFFQGGYGRPALNMLSNDFKTYYIGGARLNWNISGFYTYNKDKKIQSVNQSLLDVQKEIFLFNTNLNLKQQNNEIEKLKTLLKTDDEIIHLREKVQNTASAQLENGTITTTDYLAQVNATDQARQNYTLHQIQWLLAQYNYQTTSGN